MFRRYELHNHTTHSDASLTCRQLADRMKEDGVDVFALTDHNTISGHREMRSILEEPGFRSGPACLYGMEYTTYYGHIVCPCLSEYVPWDSIDRHAPEKLFHACKEAGGIVGIAHPFSFGVPFQRGCRFDMTVNDFTDVDFIEVINNPEPAEYVNVPGIAWWEKLVLEGKPLACTAGMDLHDMRDMGMCFATYVECEPDCDPADALRSALHQQKTWVSRGMLLVWDMEEDRICFRLVDARKPGYLENCGEKHSQYTITLRDVHGEKVYTMQEDKTLSIPFAALYEEDDDRETDRDDDRETDRDNGRNTGRDNGRNTDRDNGRNTGKDTDEKIQIAKLYMGEPSYDNLVCIAPVIHGIKKDQDQDRDRDEELKQEQDSNSNRNEKQDQKINGSR